MSFQPHLKAFKLANPDAAAHQPQATSEILSLFPVPKIGEVNWLRLFISLNVFLVFLLSAFFMRETKEAQGVRVKRKGGKRTVLLVGPLASGKTALFSRLVYGHAQDTHTSMKENEGTVKAKWGAGDFPGGSEFKEKKDEEPPAVALSNPLHLVDIPGHPRLRTRALAQSLPAADGIVFTVDASQSLTGKNARDAGEHFHIVLSLLSSLSARQQSLPSVLILLTKSDLLTSSSTSSTASPAAKSKSPTLTIDRAKQSLLRELERRRLAASGASSSSALGGSSARLSAGAKLEGLDAIPSGSSSSSGGLLSSLGLGGSFSSSSGAALGETKAGLPTDETEVLANEDVWAFEGAAEWEKLERVAGTTFEWKVGSAKKGKGVEGVEGVWEFVEGL
ncbi:hypothetical protein JCM8547_007115 [Rhodosporidiobolus lusitaniae]